MWFEDKWVVQYKGYVILLVSSDQVVLPMAMEKSQKWGEKSLLKKFDFLIKFSFFFCIYMEKWHILVVVTSNVVTHTINTFHHQKKNFCFTYTSILVEKQFLQVTTFEAEKQKQKCLTKNRSRRPPFSVIKINNDTFPHFIIKKENIIQKKMNRGFRMGVI